MTVSKGIAVPFAFITFCMLTGLAASAQSSTSPCSEKSQEFNFWIGEWDVTAGGNPAGHNRIEPILGGCAIQETWNGSGGSAGSSFNFYNPQLEKWQQFWIWQNGTTLYLTGDYADGRMVLKGDSQNRNGQTVANRVTWFDNDDGTVRQLWETSTDGGETWSVAFDGLYTKTRK
ncbi:MAG: hypothetical protein KJO98_15685 [Rhodothermia bacterium]|nr:hypothetical protein [Rhodothermia bacterium]